MLVLPVCCSCMLQFLVCLYQCERGSCRQSRESSIGMGERVVNFLPNSYGKFVKFADTARWTSHLLRAGSPPSARNIPDGGASGRLAAWRASSEEGRAAAANHMLVHCPRAHQ